MAALARGVPGIGLFPAIPRLDQRVNHFAAFSLLLVLLTGHGSLACRGCISSLLSLPVDLAEKAEKQTKTRLG
jgi:hypothetical protein